MTISNTATSITVQGDGLTTTFDYDFYMGGSANYATLVYIDENGDQTEVDSADFSITGVTDPDGGTFTYPLAGSPIAVSTSLVLSRVLPIVQNTAIGNQGNFYPSAVEGALDYLTMIAQQTSGAAGTIDAESLFGNSSAVAGSGQSIAIGSGLSFSGNMLVVSGISGSGSVTAVNTGTGLTGGPITGIGTVSLSTVTTGYVLANFSGATAAPQGVLVAAGSGITLSSTTTSLTISASNVGLTFITSSSGDGSSGTITFNNITSTFTHLAVMAYGRSTLGASPGVNIYMRFNNDSGNNYDYHLMQVANTTVAGASSASFTACDIGFIPWSSSTTFNAGWGRSDVFHYTNTSLFKVCSVDRGSLGAATVGASWIATTGHCQWRSTASITRIDLVLSVGNWVTGSIASIYGYR